MSGTSRSAAARRMRIAQIVGLCMVALAAGAVVFKPGMPEARTDAALAPGNDAEDQNTGTNASGASTKLGIDSGRAGETLNEIANIKERETVPGPEIAVKTDETEPEPAAGWMYLGGVFEPTTNFAFVSVNGAQRMIREGQELADLDTRVLSITPKMIEIERSGVRERIDRSEAVGAQVSVSEPSPSEEAVVAPGMPSARDGRILQREELENNPDMDKRRAEFLRRQRERQELDQ